MPDYFIQATTFAAPYVSVVLTRYERGDAPEAALETFVAAERESFGVYAADAFASADACFRGQPPLARWRSNRFLTQEQLTAGLTAYSLRGLTPYRFELNGTVHEVDDPFGGSIIPLTPLPADSSPAGTSPPSGVLPPAPDGGPFSGGADGR